MFTQQTIQFWYARFKDSPYYQWLIVSIAFISALFLFIYFVIPQIITWFSIRNEILATRERINILNQNITLINNLDPGILNKQVNTTTQALPFEKDFGAIVTALSIASLTSGISIDDFTFQVGDITIDEKTQKDNLSKIGLTITVSGSINALEIFLETLNEKLPLSEVVSVKGDAKTTTIIVQFYQKALPTTQFSGITPLMSINPKEQSLIDTLDSWKPINMFPLVTSSSATPLF